MVERRGDEWPSGLVCEGMKSEGCGKRWALKGLSTQSDPQGCPPLAHGPGPAVTGFPEGGGPGVTPHGWREVCARSGRVGATGGGARQGTSGHLRESRPESIALWRATGLS